MELKKALKQIQAQKRELDFLIYLMLGEIMIKIE